METQESIIFKLSPNQIQELIEDNNLIREGYQVHFVIDPSELIEFCFPFGLFKKRSAFQNINNIIEEQIALFEVFYIFKHKPILLDEYLGEVLRIKKNIDFLKTVGTNVIDQLNELKNTSKIDPNELNDEINSGDASSIIKKNFNLILAIVLGIYKQGESRFIDVYKNRINFIDPLDPNRIVEDVFSKHRGSELTSQINQEFYKYAQKSIRFSSQTEEQTYYRNSMIDAIAIDRIISINQELNDIYRSNENIKEKYLFLYLSSGAKTDFVFKSEIVKKSLPIINNTSYSLLRTREQMYTQIIFRGGADDRAETNKKLERLKYYIELKNSDFYKSDEWDTIKSSIKKVKNSYEEQIKSYGLISNYKIKEYRELFGGDQKITEDDMRYLKIFDKIISFKQKKLFLTNEKIDINDENQILSDFKLPFYSLLIGLKRLPDKSELNEKLNMGRDAVVGINHRLPLYFFNINDEKYKKLIKKITSIYIAPPFEVSLKEVCQEFLDLDIKINKINLEHELVRCLITFAHPTPDADSIVYNFADEICKSIPKDNSYRNEFNYIMLWAGRRKKDYAKTNEFAKFIIKRLSNAKFGGVYLARFYHGKCLNTYSWLLDKNYFMPPSEISFLSAIKDGEEALKLYNNDLLENSIPHKRKAITALLNTLAYMHALISRVEKADININKAREYINQLKTFSDKNKWLIHPEYLHTEAYIEYQEYLIIKETEPDNFSKMKEKLSNALREIEKACFVKKQKTDNLNIRESLTNNVSDVIELEYIHLWDVIDENLRFLEKQSN